MTLSYNLTIKPWIPCLKTDGTVIHLGLRDLLVEAHTIRSVVGKTPLETVSIYPLALAILYRALHPLNSQKDWRAIRHAGSFNADQIDTYLTAWYERFDLFSEQYPFYQSEDKRVKPKSIIYLADPIANTSTLFIHEDEKRNPIWSFEKTAMTLLIAQQFRLGGGKSGGETENHRDSPYARGILFWAQGETLFETLALNLMPLRFVDSFQSTVDDRPAWEMDDPFSPLREIPLGYLDYLTWQTNRIKLYQTKDETGVVEFRIAPTLYLDSEVLSPQKRYTKSVKKNETLFHFMYFNENRAIWREYHTLLQLGNDAVRPPKVIDWLATVNEGMENFQLLGVGQLADQAKTIFYRQEVLPLSSALLSNETCVILIAQAIESADEVQREVLTPTLKAFARRILMRGGQGAPDPNNITDLVNHWNIELLYWERLEPHFWEFIATLTDNLADAQEFWNSLLRSIVRETFSIARERMGNDLVIWQAQVEANHVLEKRLKKVLPLPLSEEK